MSKEGVSKYKMTIIIAGDADFNAFIKTDIDSLLIGRYKQIKFIDELKGFEFDHAVYIGDLKSIPELELIMKRINVSYNVPTVYLDSFVSKRLKTSDRIIEIAEGMKSLLLEKNKRYGDAAINPKKRFSKLSGSDSILVRLDDKMNRIENSGELRTNDACDMIGYLMLYLISKGISKQDILNLID